MSRLIKAGEPKALRRRVYFHLVKPDGISPATGEDGGQPEISVNGGMWQSDGITPLVSIGYGRYYAVIIKRILTLGAHIETRYRSDNTAEIPGDSVDVIALNVYSGSTLNCPTEF
jgi:hypothetical protein